MSRAVSRRRFTFTTAAAALAAPALLPRKSLGADARIDFVHLLSGADHPIQRSSRPSTREHRRHRRQPPGRRDLRDHHPEDDDGDRRRPAPAMMTTGWKLGAFARKHVGRARSPPDLRRRPHRRAARQLPPAVRPPAYRRAAYHRPAVVDDTPVLYVNLTLWWRPAWFRSEPKTVEQLYAQARQLQERTAQAGPDLRSQRVAAAGLHPERRRRRDRCRRQPVMEAPPPIIGIEPVRRSRAAARTWEADDHRRDGRPPSRPARSVSWRPPRRASRACARP